MDSHANSSFYFPPSVRPVFWAYVKSFSHTIPSEQQQQQQQQNTTTNNNKSKQPTKPTNQPTNPNQTKPTNRPTKQTNKPTNQSNEQNKARPLAIQHVHDSSTASMHVCLARVLLESLQSLAVLLHGRAMLEADQTTGVEGVQDLVVVVCGLNPLHQVIQHLVRILL